MQTHLVPAVVPCRIDQDSGTDSLIGVGHEHQPLHRGALCALVSASTRLHIRDEIPPDPNDARISSAWWVRLLIVPAAMALGLG